MLFAEPSVYVHFRIYGLLGLDLCASSFKSVSCRLLGNLRGHTWSTAQALSFLAACTLRALVRGLWSYWTLSGLFLVSVVGRLCMLASALREERGGVDGASIPSCLTLGFSFGFTGCCKWMC